jgi:hypothetical protein
MSEADIPIAAMIRELERQGIKPRGKKWHSTTVRRIIDKNLDT